MYHGIRISTDQPAVVLAHCMPPVAVPILVELVLVGDNGVVDAAGGADHEVIAGASVAVEVDHQVDPVDLILEVALHTLPRARHRRGLVATERHRKAFRRSQDPGLGVQ